RHNGNLRRRRRRFKHGTADSSYPGEDRSRRSMKTFLLLCSLIAGSSLGEILSAKGMQQVGDVSFRPKALLRTANRIVRNPYLFGAITCLALSFFSFISL